MNAWSRPAYFRGSGRPKWDLDSGLAFRDQG